MGVAGEAADENVVVEVSGDAVRRYHRPARDVTGGESLGEGEKVGRHAVVIDGEPPPRSSEPGQDFVGDEQHAMTIADLADAAPIPRRGREYPVGSHHPLEDDGRDRLRPLSQELRFQVLRALMGTGRRLAPEGTAEAVGSPIRTTPGKPGSNGSRRGSPESDSMANVAPW